MIYCTIFKRRALGKLKSQNYWFSDLIKIIYFIILSIAIYSFSVGNNEQLAGMTIKQISTYIVFSVVFGEITTINSVKIANKVHKDKFLFEFLKPYSYRGKALTESLADFVVGCVTKLFPVLVLVGLSGYLEPPKDVIHLCVFIVSFVLGAILWCNLELAFQMFGFWCKDVYNVFFIIGAVYRVFAGGMVLYCILPKLLYMFFKFTPLYYIITLPMDIFIGKIDAKSMILGIGIQLCWIILIVILQKIIFNAGKRKLQKGD